MEKFGKRIRSIREQAQKSMKDAAIVMGISVVEYSDIERSRREPPSGKQLHKLADFLDISPEEMKIWAMLERKRVELSLENKSQTIVDCALKLGEKWANITENEAAAIMRILQPENTAVLRYS